MANEPQMRFILSGFIPEQGFRLFTFQGITDDKTRVGYTVRTDLALIRKYGIHVQDLPLLCRELLERRADAEAAHHITFTEEDMRLHQIDRAAAKQAATRKRTPPRRPPTDNAARSGWRTTSPLSVQSHA